MVSNVLKGAPLPLPLPCCDQFQMDVSYGTGRLGGTVNAVWIL
jgi:hypothetical protein